MVEKELQDMITTKSFSLKIKNKLKIERLAKENDLNVSAYLNKIIEGIE